MRYNTFALYFLIWAGFACLFLFIKVNVKDQKLPKVQKKGNENVGLYSRGRCSNKPFWVTEE